MIDTTQTNYILADTRAEVLNTPPGPGLLAISKDTSSLFVSDGDRWIETNITYKHNIEHAVTANTSLTQSPVLHFDTSVDASMENIRSKAATEQQPVARINSLVSNEALISKPHYAGVYTENDVNNNSAIVFTGAQGMIPDLRQSQKRDGGATIICVLTPTPNVLGNGSDGQPRGLERVWTPHDPEEGGYGTNRYSSPTITSHQNYFSTYQHHNYGSTITHKVANTISNSNNHVYVSGEGYVSAGFNQSTYSIDAYPSWWFDENDVADPVNGGPGNRVHHYNQNYIGKPQIFSIRIESNKQINTGGALKVACHTWYPSVYDYDYAWHLRQDTNYQHKSSELNHGLALGKNQSGFGSTGFNVYMSFHEMMYFDKYLTDKDLNLLGESLASKWNTGIGDTWRL